MYSPAQRLYQEFYFDFEKNPLIGTYSSGLIFPRNCFIRVANLGYKTTFVSSGISSVSIGLTGGSATFFTNDITSLISASVTPTIFSDYYLLFNGFATGVSNGFTNVNAVPTVELNGVNAVSGIMIVGFEYTMIQ